MASPPHGTQHTSPHRVLLAWEHGGALGHITSLGALAHQLRARGAHVGAILKHTQQVDRWFPPDVACHLAPVSPHTPTGQPDFSYADVLARTGWGDSELLGAQTRQWRAKIEAFDPDVVVADSAPTVHLALRGTSYPVIGFGAPWFAPPSLAEMPPLQWWIPSDPGAAKREREVLRAVNRCRTVGPKLTALSHVWDETQWILHGPPALDPWRDHRDGRTTYAGVTAVLDRGGTQAYPPGPGPRVFAYLKAEYIWLDRVLQALDDRSCSTVAYIAGNDGGFTSTQHTTVVPHPLALDRMRRSADLLVTHSALITGTAFLQAGVPGLFLPMHLEQLASGRCAAMRLKGVATLPRGAVESQLSRALDTVLHPAIREATRAQASDLLGPDNPMEWVASQVLKATSSSR